MQIIPYIIKSIREETKDVFSWEIVPQKKPVLQFISGQFAMIHTLNDKTESTGKRAYSIASSPLNKDYLEFGIKLHGEFTHKINKLKPGSTIGVQGPFGVFTYNKKKHKNAAFFAGGIGITPFISMLRYAAEAVPENKIILYYCNQTEQDIPFKKNLDKLNEENENFSVIYSVDKCFSDDWTGEIGLINEDNIKKNVPELNNKHFFVCGPVPFMQAVGNILTNNGIKNDRIKKEIF